MRSYPKGVDSCLGLLLSLSLSLRIYGVDQSSHKRRQLLPTTVAVSSNHCSVSIGSRCFFLARRLMEG